LAPGCPDFAPLPVYWLAQLDPLNLFDGTAGQLSYPERPVEKILI
jgi:hypothetical protein